MMVRLFHQGKVCDINYRVCSKEEHSAQLWRAERCPSWFQSYKARSRQEESFFKLPTAWKHCLSSSFSPKSLSFPRIHFYQNSISVPATHFYMRMNVGRLLCWVYYFTTVVWLSTEKKKMKVYQNGVTVERNITSNHTFHRRTLGRTGNSQIPLLSSIPLPLSFLFSFRFHDLFLCSLSAFVERRPWLLYKCRTTKQGCSVSHTLYLPFSAFWEKIRREKKHYMLWSCRSKVVLCPD